MVGRVVEWKMGFDAIVDEGYETCCDDDACRC